MTNLPNPQKDEEAFKFHMMSQMEIKYNINPPDVYVSVFMTDSRTKPYTWAERRRDKLTYKLKKRIAWMHRIILLMLFLFTETLILYGSFNLINILHITNGLYGIIIGEMVILTAILCHALSFDFMPTDPYYVNIKRYRK